LGLSGEGRTGVCHRRRFRIRFRDFDLTDPKFGWRILPFREGSAFFLFKVLVTARRSQELVFWQGCPSKEIPVRVQSEIAHDLPWQSFGRSPLTRLGAWPIYFEAALPCPTYFQGDSYIYLEVVAYLEVDSKIL